MQTKFSSIRSSRDEVSRIATQGYWKRKSKNPGRLIQVFVVLIVASLTQWSFADDISWNGNPGNGLFFDGNNWTPFGAPQESDVIRIGNLAGTAGTTVMMGTDWGIIHSGLYLSNGVTLDMNGSELLAFDPVVITGENTRLIARPAPFLNMNDFVGHLQLGSGAYFELRDDVGVTLLQSSFSSGTILGRGTLFTSDFNNNGIIRPDNNGGLNLFAGSSMPDQLVDLDGSLGTGNLQLTTLFSQLQVNALGLTDSFSGNISMAPGALLEMNIADGWIADSLSEINVIGFTNPAASQISGSHFSFGGTINVSLAQGKLHILAPMTIQATANVNVGHTDQLAFNGATIVNGGTFNLGQFGQLEFNGPTTLSGGEFHSFANNFNDGTIAFNGATTWNGVVTLNGAARQQGTATVSGVFGATINADRFDMDGLSGNTTWNINSGLTVNAEMISTTNANRFGGTMNIGGGFAPRVNINLQDPNASWVLGGTMNLSGLTHLLEAKIDGSDLVVEGDLNVAAGRVRVNANTHFVDFGFAGPAAVTIAANAELHLTGLTEIDGGVQFAGSGTLVNSDTGTMYLTDQLALDDVGLINEGRLNLDAAAGIVSVDRFTNTGIWQIDIGGLLAGAEHDMLLVTGGPAELGGILDVRLMEFVGPDFFPEIGDEFTILSALGGINGEFASDPISLLQGKSYFWTVLYNPNDVTLRLSSISVPEPTLSAVLLVAGVVLALRRSRRNPSLGDCPQRPKLANDVLGWYGRIKLHDQKRSPALPAIVGIFCGSVLIQLLISDARAQQVDWNAGVGVWSNGNNWTPVGVPVAIDNVAIGNGSEAMVNLNQAAEIASLTILSGSALNTQSSLLTVNGDTLVQGFGGFAGLTPSRLIVGPRDGLSIRTDKLTIENGALVEFTGGIANIHDRLSIDDSSELIGLGIINLYRTGTSLVNNGRIEAGTNYGLIVQQINGGGFDLDGTSGEGRLRITDYDDVNDWGAQMRFEGSHLTDSFSGQLTIGSGGQLAMNLSDGWVVDSSGEFLVGWSSQTVTPARITGGPLDFSGEIYMLGTDGIVASDLQLRSEQIRFRNAARIDTSTNNVLTIGGEQTSLVQVDGGEFGIGQGSSLEFSAPTVISGGEFQTHSDQFSDGSVEFHGPTTWNGTTHFQGAVRQNGTATVNGLGATINAERFDIDGFNGSTTWNINSSLVINAIAVESTSSNRFDGTMNIAGGVLPRLTLNLTSPADSWTMAGEMNLSGLTQFFETRLAGAAVIYEGQLNVIGGRVRVNSDAHFTGSQAAGPAQVSIATGAVLRMEGNTLVEGGVEFSGDGTLLNAELGVMRFNDEVALNDVGFENQGHFEIGAQFGVVSVDRFVNSGTWRVDIGGFLAGAQHDLLLVGGDTQLGGFLDVQLFDAFDSNFLPAIGDEFTILYAAGDLVGEFLDDPISNYAGQQFHWSVLYHPHDVTLRLDSISSIPEPTFGILLLVLGMCLVGFRDRRK